MRWIGALLLALCLVGAAQAQQVNLYCNNGATGPSAWQPCVSGNPLAVSASVSASVSGFTPSASGARATPLTVTTSDSSGTLPTGAVVIVSNVGSNPMYCNVNGAAATTSDQPIASGVGNWFAFTIPVGVTTLHCIATGGSTTANMLGGSGLATGSGGGGGGAASTVTANQGTATAGTAWPVSLASVPLPSGASTAANQATEISSLATIATNTGAAIPAGTNNIGGVELIDSGGTNKLSINSSGVASTAEQNGSAYPNKANFVSGTGSGTDTSAHTIISAPGSGKIYVTGAQCSRDDVGTTAIHVTLNDGASTILILPNNGGGGNNAVFPTPLVVAATTALTFTSSNSTSTVRCSAQGYNAS